MIFQTNNKLTDELELDEVVRAGVLQQDSVLSRRLELEADVARHAALERRQLDRRVRLTERDRVVKQPYNDERERIRTPPSLSRAAQHARRHSAPIDTKQQLGRYVLSS